MPFAARSLAAVVLGAAVLFAATPSRAVAQNAVAAAPTVAPDSAAPRRVMMLAEVTVAAAPAPARKKSYMGTLREYRDLQGLSRDFARQIGKLERHLDSLKTEVAPRLEREAAQMDAQAAELRQRRLALEARVAAMQARQAAAKDSTAVVGGGGQ
jgi:hypothetical protein